LIKILHVDDNRDDLDLISMQLSRRDGDLKIDWAESAVEALERIRETNYD